MMNKILLENEINTTGKRGPKKFNKKVNVSNKN